MNWEDVIIDAAATDTGMRRSNNQDSYAVVRASQPEVWKQRGHVFLVADGMGAHAVGELASQMACDLIPHNYMKMRAGTPAEAITRTFRDVSALIHSRASANREFQGMGTTSSALLLLPQGALVAHVGDSRVYRVRGPRIDQLSFDHSLIWELVWRNHLTPEQANQSVPKNVITRSLGPEAEIEVDIEGPLAVEMGDVYLLCSDGLSGPVEDDELGAFAAGFHPRDACRYLLNLANLRGGLDNITVLVVRLGAWVEPDTAETAHQPMRGRSSDGRAGPGGLGRILGLFKGRRSGKSALVEDNPYRTAECSISDEMLCRLRELIRNAREQAIEQSWSIDWNALSTLGRQESDARSANNNWMALRKLGEMIALLGQSARFHRKGVPT